MLALHFHDFGSAQIPAARALLAVRRAARAADCRRARRARSRFPALEVARFAAALEIARAAAEFRETGAGDARRYRARFWSSEASSLRDLFQIVGGSDAAEVLIDDRPVPYARELWLPLVWFLIPR